MVKDHGRNPGGAFWRRPWICQGGPMEKSPEKSGRTAENDIASAESDSVCQRHVGGGIGTGGAEIRRAGGADL